MPKITFETFEFGKDIKYNNMFGKWRLWIFFVFLAKKIHKNLMPFIDNFIKSEREVAAIYHPFRNNIYDIIKNKLGDIKPKRFGTGETMTVAVIRDIDIKSKLINLKEFIKEYEKIVDDIASELNKNVIAS